MFNFFCGKVHLLRTKKLNIYSLKARGHWPGAFYFATAVSITTYSVCNVI